LSNFIKVLGIIAIIVVVALLVNTFIIKIVEIPQFLIDNFPAPVVLVFFFLSESFLGMIPPDVFILWVTGMPDFYLWVLLLSLISYAGGFGAFYIGVLVRKIPKVKARAEIIYANHIHKIKKWGSIFIIIAAMFPIPYAIVCSLAGMMKFPVVRLFYLGIFRIARFFIYAALIDQVL
jgi:membrane protein YqaA with SNARE-associated domain